MDETQALSAAFDEPEEDDDELEPLPGEDEELFHGLPVPFRWAVHCPDCGSLRFFPVVDDDQRNPCRCRLISYYGRAEIVGGVRKFRGVRVRRKRDVSIPTLNGHDNSGEVR